MATAKYAKIVSARGHPDREFTEPEKQEDQKIKQGA
jgi:hypothetical protein